MEIKKFSVIVAFFAVLAGFGTNALAQNATSTIDLNSIYQTLGVSAPSLLPTSPFYFLKEWRRDVRLFFTFNTVSKAELETQYANEKLAETLTLSAEKPDRTAALKSAFQNYLDASQELQNRLGKLAGTNKNADELLGKLADNAVEHQKLFNELENKLGSQEIKQADQENADTVKAALKVNEDEFKSKLEEKIKEDKGNDLEDLGSLEELQNNNEDIKSSLEDLTDNFRGEIKNAKERAAGALKDATEKINELDQKISSASSTPAENLTVLAQNGKDKLAAARAAFDSQNYGMAFGQARAAKSLAENALDALENGGQNEQENENRPEENTKENEEEATTTEREHPERKREEQRHNRQEMENQNAESTTTQNESE